MGISVKVKVCQNKVRFLSFICENKIPLRKSNYDVSYSFLRIACLNFVSFLISMQKSE